MKLVKLEKIMKIKEYDEIRAGDSKGIFVNHNLDVPTFQPIRQAPPLPHIQSALDLLFGKPKSDQLFCQQASMFDPQEFEESSPYSLEVLSKENALARINEKYGTLEHPKFDYIDESLG